MDYFGERRFPEASIEFRKAIQKDPKAWAAHYYLALTEINLRHPQEAYRELNTVIGLQPSFQAARLDLGDLLLATGQSYQARVQAQDVVAAQPTNLRAVKLLGRIDLVRENYAQAIEDFQEARRLAPQDPALALARGIARVGAKQYALGEADFRTAIALDPKSPEGYRNLANLFRLTGRKGEVEPLIARALGLIPNSLDLYLALADFYFQEGDLESIGRLFSSLKSRLADFPGLQERLGDFWILHNDPRRAAPEFDAAVRSSSDPSVRKKHISAYITLGRWKEADQFNQQLLAKNPKDFDCRAFHAALRCLQGDPPGAVVELRGILKEEPQSLFANYYLGLALMSTGELEQAEAAFSLCVGQNRRFIQAYQKLAEIRLAHKDWEVAKEYAQEVAALDPIRPEGYILLAQAYLDHDQPQKVEQALKPIESQAQELAPFHELLGAALLKEGKTTPGIREYRRAWGLSQDKFGVMTRLADALVSQAGLARAIQAVGQLAMEAPHPKTYDVLARLYLSKGDVPASESACQRALELDSQDWVPHFYLGAAFRRLGRHEEALSQYTQVLRVRPDLVPAYILAGDLCLEDGWFDRGKGYYQAALQRDPSSVPAQHGLARVWAERGERLNEALAVVQGLQNKLPDDPYLSDTLGWIFYQKGQYSLALDALKRSIENHPKNSLFLFHLGLVYGKLGEASLSRQAFEAALKIGLPSSRCEALAQKSLGYTAMTHGDMGPAVR